MSMQHLRGHRHLSVVMPMLARDANEAGRAATPLELFFDLVAVVAVALAAEQLHLTIVEGSGPSAILPYALVFFSIWWWWVQFTWFASTYDNDDIAYRISVFVIMTGALVFAAGVPRFFDQQDFTLSVIGYSIMRVSLVGLWLRVGRDDGPRRETARRFVIGLSACQLGWLFLFVVPDLWVLVWLVMAPLELLVPVWAERAERTTFHAEHITERYGLFMIIVLGESVLAGSFAIQSAMSGEGLSAELIGVFAGALLILYAMWWVYFDRPDEHLLDSLPTAFAWSYLHLPIFASVAAVGAGLVVAIEQATGHAQVGWTGVGVAIATPLILYLLTLWTMYLGHLRGRFQLILIPMTVFGLVAAIFTPFPVLALGLVLVAFMGAKAWRRVRSDEPGAGPISSLS